MVGHDAFLAVGLTYRQLDHWTRKGYLQASAYRDETSGGRHRSWPAGEVSVAAVALRLVAVGLKVPAAIDVARGNPVIAPGIRITVDA